MNWTSDELLMVVWRASWQAAILAVLVYLICRIFQRSVPASAKTLLCLLPVLRLVVLIVPASSFSMFNATTILGNRISTTLQSQTIPSLKPQYQTLPSQNLPSQAASSPALDNISTQDLALHDVAPHHSGERPFAPASTEDQANNERSMNGEQAVFNARSMTLPENSPINESISPNEQRFTTADVLVLAWLVGVGMCLLRYVWAHILLRKVIQSGKAIRLESIMPLEVSDSMKKLAPSVRFIVVENECGPAVTGVLRPIVLLPQRMLDQFSMDELSMVVMHELEHVRRFDTSLLFFAQLATILHWFNPLAYWLRKRLQAQVEIAVDATTVRRLGLDSVKQYAELLFKVSSSNTTPAFLLSMARRSSYFRYRIEQLAEIEPHKPFRTVIGALTILVLAMTGLSDLASGELNSTNPNSTVPATAASGSTTAKVAEATNAEPNSEVEQESTPKSTDNSVKSLEKQTDPNVLPHPLSVMGKVVDSLGKGVPNAKLLCKPRNKTTPISVTADSEGNFLISFPRDADKFDSFYTWVYAEGFGLRVVAMRRVLKDGKSATDVEIPLPPLEQNATVEVRDPNGNPVPDALVMPVRFELPIGRFYSDEPEGASTPIRNELIESVAARTDQNGIARFNHFPTAMWRGLSCQTTQYGEQRFDFRTNSNQIKISLKPVGSIRGKIASFDPSKFPTLGFEIVTRSLDRKSDLTGVSSGQFNEKGEFQIPVIAAGRISSFRVGTLDASTDTGPELICEDNLQQELKPNSNIEFMLYSPPMVQVSGTVLTSDTRKPVKGVEISVGRKNGPHRRRFTTDENGEFQFGVAPGKVNFQMISRGDATDLTMKYGFSRAFPDLITEDTKLEILLPVNKQVEGLLQDTSGNPLGDRTIARNESPSGIISGITTTDANGRFEIYVDRLPTDSNGYWSLVDNADILRRPVTVVNQLSKVDEFYVLEKPHEPITPPRKVVQERPAVHPLSNSDAALPDPTNEEPSSGWGEQESTVKAGDKSDDSEKPASAEKSNEADPISDLMSVSGQVVDSQGKGVPNAKLFYIPDYQANPTQVTTDDGGNFSISYPPHEPYQFDTFITWVCADGFGLRVVAMRRLLHDEKSVKDVKIPLPPLEQNTTSIEVRDPNGVPLQDVLVMPDIIQLPNGSFIADESEGLGTSIPNQLIEYLAVRTDKDGKASFNRFPNALWHGIRCQSDQFGTQSDESARPTRLVKLSLQHVGKIHGRIDSFDPTSFPTLNFLIETNPVAGSTNLKGLGYGKFNDKGEFSISAIAVGSIDRFLVAKGEVCSGNDAEVMFENYRSMKVLPDNTLEIVLTAPPTVRVSGVVLTSDTREPVPGSVISCYRKNSPHHRQFVTNENGEFEIQVVPGNVQFQMTSVSTSKEISRKYAFGQFPDAITEDTKLEILLTARKSVKGRLQDASGKPIANQDLWRFGKNRLSINGVCQTDADGNFEMFPFGATVQSEGFWAIVDKSEYRRRAAIKTVVRQISNDGDFYVLEQPSNPIAAPTGR